jgi:hypothetical protein
MRQFLVFQSVSMAPGRRTEAQVYKLGNVGFGSESTLSALCAKVRLGPFPTMVLRSR